MRDIVLRLTRAGRTIMIKRGELTMALILALAGCASGPDYARPEVALPAQWGAAPATGAVEAPAALPDWHAFFPDARLQALIARALEHNRDLRIATARIAEAKAQYGISRAAQLPEVELFGKREASRTPADLSGYGYQVNAQRYDVGAELLSYEIDFWGRVRRLNEAALASYLSSEEAQRAFRLSLIADVANAYFTQRELEERVRLARAIADNRNEVRTLSEQRRQAGLINSMDFLRTDAANEAARIELASLEQSRAEADHWLQLLTGDLSSNSAAALPLGRDLSAQDLARVAANLPAEVLLRRPDVLAAEQQLVAANANIGAARAAFLPRITLTGALSTASASLSHLFEAGSKAWIFKPQLRLPLFDTGRLEGNVDLAEARKNIAVAEYEKAIQQSFSEVADLLSAREHLGEQLRAQEATQRIQSERVALMEARYKAEISHFLEVLDARRDQLLAQQNVLQTRRMVLSSAAQLYKALGGGKEK
jgi:multidrug efflux system outer membrane protein